MPRSKLPVLAKQFLAETLGTFLLVLFGDGAIAQYKTQMGSGTPTIFPAVAWGYGLALMIGILASGGVSGGHLNPAVTLAMACLKKCSWKQLPVYWVAQYLGAFLGAALLYGIYYDGFNHTINLTDADVAGVFATYPGNGKFNIGTLIADQLLGTALLLIIILAVTDSRNMNVPSGMVPILIGFGLTAIHLSFAFNAGCAVNPARDLMPRIVTLIFGFPESFTSYDYFFWIPWIIPHFGAVFGAVIYFFGIEMHHEPTLLS